MSLNVALISILSFAISASICYFLIIILNSKKLYVKNKPELLVQNAQKATTPGFGGISFITTTILITIFFSENLGKNFTIIALGFLGFALEGFIDDFVKLKTFNGDGITPKQKLLIEFLLSALIAYLIFKKQDINIFYYIFAVFYIFYFITAVNITDGLDGLSTLTVTPVLILLLIILVQKGNLKSISFTFILSLFCALLGFFIFNHNPAKIFMGDLGSQALGAAIAIVSLLYHLELIILISTLVLFFEFFSSLIQIISIRYFHKKIFKIAPLHHLLEANNYSENKIVLIWFFSSIGFSLIAYFVGNVK